MVIAMRSLFTIALLLALAAESLAASANLTIIYQSDTSWQVAGDKTYLNLQIGEITASRRLAVNFFADGVLVGSVWDKPSLREYNISIALAGTKSSAHIAAQAVAYECGPWKASTAYSVGDKVCVGEYPSALYWMEVTRAGTSGSSEPTWPAKHGFTLARSKTLAAAAVTNLGSGTVGIPVTAHGYYQGESVTISGSTNYNGTHTLPAQTSGSADVLVITHSFTSETMAGTETVVVANSAVVDNGGGTVNIPCIAHGLVSGQDVTIAGTTNYNGTYTLGTQASTDFLTVTATYVAESITGGYVIDKTIDDANGSGTGWTLTDAPTAPLTPLVILISDSSRRQVGDVVEGAFKLSGPKFRVRNN